MIHIYFIDIFKCKLFLYCLFIYKDTYEPPKFLFQMFITYLMYTIITIIKVKRVAEKKRIAFKDFFNFFNCIFKLTIRKVVIFCC